MVYATVYTKSTTFKMAKFDKNLLSLEVVRVQPMPHVAQTLGPCATRIQSMDCYSTPLDRQILALD